MHLHHVHHPQDLIMTPDGLFAMVGGLIAVIAQAKPEVGGTWLVGIIGLSLWYLCRSLSAALDRKGNEELHRRIIADQERELTRLRYLETEEHRCFMEQFRRNPASENK